MNNTFKVILGSTTAIAALGAVAFAANHHSYSGSTPPRGDVPETQPTRQHAAAIASVRGTQIAALERARTATDAVPPDVADNPIFSDGVVNFATARRLPGKTPRWIARSANGENICVFTSGALACPPASAIADRGADVNVAWHADSSVIVSGVTTDAVHEVSIELRDGSVQTVPVSGNTFEFETEHMPATVRWSGPRGPEHRNFPAGIGR